jgi:Domain of unknown function (DUF4158)
MPPITSRKRTFCGRAAAPALDLGSPSAKYVHQTCGVHNPDRHFRDEGEDFMARRPLLSGEERRLFFGVPVDPDAVARQYTFTRSDQDRVADRRGAANRLGFAVQPALRATPPDRPQGLRAPPAV